MQNRTFREHALHLHEQLAEQLQTMRFLEYKLKHRSDQDLAERGRLVRVSAAVEHLEQSMAALEIASRD